MNHLAEREREKKEEGKKKEEEEKKKEKKKKKELSTESNLGPLILRDIGRYAAKAYQADTLKGPGENTNVTPILITTPTSVNLIVKIAFECCPVERGPAISRRSR